MQKFNKTAIVILILTGFIFLSSCCKRSRMTVYPAPNVFLSEYKDTFYVGDTIHVRIEADADLVKKCDELFYTEDSYNIFQGLGKYVNDINLESALGNSELIVDSVKYDWTKRQYSTGAVLFRGYLEKHNNKFLLEYSFTLTETGVFEFFMDSFDGNEFKKIFPFILYLPPGKDHNTDIAKKEWEYYNHQELSGNNYFLNFYYEHAAYVFYVVER